MLGPGAGAGRRSGGGRGADPVGEDPARRARWRLAPPSSAASSCARLYSQCTSASHVKPMPPWAWIALAVTSRPASEAAALAIAAASAQPLGVGVGGPRRERGRRARLLGVEQHLRAAVRDRLEGAHRHAELLALLDVGHGHLERPLAHAHELRADRHERAAEARAARRPRAPRRRPSAALTRAAERVGSIDATGVTSASSGVEHARRCRPLRRARSRCASAPPITSSAAPSTARAERADRLAARRAPAASARAARASPPARSRTPPSRSAGTAPAPASARAPRTGSTARSRPSPWPPCSSAIAIPGQPSSHSSRHSASSVRARLGVLAHALGLRALGQQLARGALDLALVVGEAEVHATPRPRPSAAAGRARARRRCS